MDKPVFYILMRTDLASMNPGKGMAQAAHAQADFAAYNPTSPNFIEWKENRNFGTTIVLAVDTDDEMVYTIKYIENYIVKGIVRDLTYPIKDGLVTHLLPINTCAWVFTRDTSELSHLSLHS